MNPTISVVIPAFNRQVYLVDAINSVLQQSYTPTEIVVVDDGSTDHTFRLGNYYWRRGERPNGSARFIHLKENRGIAYARNVGVLESKGEYIAVMDSDDVMLKDRLKKSLKALTDNVDVVYTSYYIGDERARVQGIYTPPAKPTRQDFKSNGAIPHVTILARRSCFEQNPYRNDFRVNDDAALLADWYNAGYTFKRVKEPLTIVRSHERSVSREKEKEIKRTQKIVDRLYEDPDS